MIFFIKGQPDTPVEKTQNYIPYFLSATYLSPAVYCWVMLEMLSGHT